MYLHAENWETVQANANKFDIHSRAAIRGKKKHSSFLQLSITADEAKHEARDFACPTPSKNPSLFFSNIRVSGIS